MWRIPLYLFPVALLMLWIRRREALEGATRSGDLTPGQKAWVLVQALPPGVSAGLITCLSVEEQRGYFLEGSRLQGSGQNLLAGVVREFCATLPREWTRGLGRDLEQCLALLVCCADTDRADLAGRLTRLWPPPPAPVQVIQKASVELPVAVDPAPGVADAPAGSELPVQPTTEAQAGALPPEAEQGP